MIGKTYGEFLDMTDRLQQIKKILNDLEVIKKDPAYKDRQYAIDANIEFFEATKSVFSYARWLVRVAKKLDPTRLLEINDLLPKYDKQMHTKLVKMERKIPGLIGLIVNRLYGYIKTQNRDLVILNLGSGTMEVERQVIKKLVKDGFTKKVFFVGVDLSSDAHKGARDNLLELKDIAEIYFERELTSDFLKETTKNSVKKYFIVQILGDAILLNTAVKGLKFDVVFHTLFRHHLTSEQCIYLDRDIMNRGNIVMEYDGFKDMFSTIPQTIIGWTDPIFLNAEIFSNLRFMEKKSIESRRVNLSGHLKTSKIGYYLLEYAKHSRVL